MKEKDREKKKKRRKGEKKERKRFSHSSQASRVSLAKIPVFRSSLMGTSSFLFSSIFLHLLSFPPFMKDTLFILPSLKIKNFKNFNSGESNPQSFYQLQNYLFQKKKNFIITFFFRQKILSLLYNKCFFFLKMFIFNFSTFA